MVLATLIRHTAKRIPTIKFRKGGNGGHKAGHPLEGNLEPNISQAAAAAAAPRQVSHLFVHSSLSCPLP